MASANFNREIVSSINDTTLEYNLDDVIIKDFDGNPGYSYILNGDVPTPVGVIIEERQGTGTYLIIPSSAQFNLSIIVYNNDKNNPIEAIANTSVNLEETPVANFNTKILSSSSNEQMVLDSDIREYVLDEVIDKNFPGPYKYDFFRSDVASVDFPENGAVGIAFPRGLEIIENMEGQQVLLVGPNIEFELSIFVGNRARIEAIATTMITIDEKISFSNEITKLLNNQTLQEKFSNTKNDWAKIINRDTNEKVDDGIKYPSGDVIKEL
jgi:hypothetical protein